MCPRTITKGNPKWSRHAPRKAHFMNAETDRRAWEGHSIIANEMPSEL